MDDLYRDEIIERFKNPQYFGELDPNDFTYADDNPMCGDHIRIDVRVDENNRVTDAAFSGHGCAISLAAADMLLESVIGKTLDEVKAVSKKDILDMLGMELGPVRLKCALLPLKVIKVGVYGLGESLDGLDEEE